jgi:hypothetical protein
MTGNVFEHRKYTSVRQTLRKRCRKRSDLIGPRPKGAISNYGVCSRYWNVGDRHAIDIDSHRREIGRNQSSTQPRGCKTPRMIAVIDRPINCGRGIFRPGRRAHTLHTAAFLVDKDGSIPAYRRSKVVSKAAKGIWAGYVALEDDQAPRLGVAQQCALLVGQGGSGNSGDEGAHVGRRPSRAARGSGVKPHSC